MFSFETSPVYADVFLDYHTAMSWTIAFFVMNIVSLLILTASVLGYLRHKVLILSFVLIGVVSMIGCTISSERMQDIRSQVIANMKSNVAAKFGAELELRDGLSHNLNEPSTYKLRFFDDGASGEYEIYFEKSGEPMVIEKATAPSVKELNSEAK